MTDALLVALTELSQSTRLALFGVETCGDRVAGFAVNERAECFAWWQERTTLAIEPLGEFEALLLTNEDYQRALAEATA